MLHYMQAVAKKVGLSDSNKKYFALFLKTEHDFGKTKHCSCLVQYDTYVALFSHLSESGVTVPVCNCNIVLLFCVLL